MSMMRQLATGLARRLGGAPGTPPRRLFSSSLAAPPSAPLPSPGAAQAPLTAAVAEKPPKPPKGSYKFVPTDRVYKLEKLKTSAQKVQVVARLVNVRGFPVEKAVGYLKFLPQKAATMLRAVLEMALRRAPFELGWDPKRMIIDAIWTGRCTYLRRPDYKAKGRMGLIKKPKTNIYAKLREVPLEEAQAFKLKIKRGAPDVLAYRRERYAARRADPDYKPVLRAHQLPRIAFWPLC
ncbi:ribosomal protein L22/L17 [Pavlovales sp. CCMP2436]|nr:ribosomal protein L22/L17 [Pavlovales sp. CCMP2436]